MIHTLLTNTKFATYVRRNFKKKHFLIINQYKGDVKGCKGDKAKNLWHIFVSYRMDTILFLIFVSFSDIENWEDQI